MRLSPFRILALVLLFATGAGPIRGQQSSPATSPAAPPVAAATDRPPKAPPSAEASPLLEAQQLYRKGEFDAAVEKYQAILKQEPKSAAAYAGLARVYLKQKKVDDAAAAAKSAIDADATSAAAHIALGEVYFRQGKFIEAEHEFLPVVQTNAKEARANYGLARVYFASSFYFHAKVQIDLAHQLDPEDPDIRRKWMSTLGFKERLAALKGYLEEGGNDDGDEREHMETALASMQEADEQGRKGCRLVSTAKSADMKLEKLMRDASHLRGVGLHVELNGSGSTLLLDTGAGGILIDRKLAEKAGVKRVATSDIHGIGDKGPVGGYIGVVDSIKVGDIELQGCHVQVVDRRSVAEGEGLIGADVFSHFLVDIDMPNSRFRLTPLPEDPPATAEHLALQRKFPGSEHFHDRYVAPEMKGYAPVFRFGAHLFIPTRINELPPKLFLIDTGAFNDTISPAAAREATKVRIDSNLHVKGLSGEVKNVFTADDLTLTFSHYRQPARNMVAFETAGISEGAGAEVGGILGFGMLHLMELKIDYRDGLVDFAYDPNRIH
jgi:tetratricopeptide (TPR) repeat protein